MCVIEILLRTFDQLNNYTARKHNRQHMNVWLELNSAKFHLLLKGGAQVQEVSISSQKFHNTSYPVISQILLHGCIEGGDSILTSASMGHLKKKKEK